jgi:hypothetical protein
MEQTIDHRRRWRKLAIGLSDVVLPDALFGRDAMGLFLVLGSLNTGGLANASNDIRRNTACMWD